MVLGKLPVQGRPTIWITVGQGSDIDLITVSKDRKTTNQPTIDLAVGAGGGCFDLVVGCCWA